jgi:hypothetical protein
MTPQMLYLKGRVRPGPSSSRKKHSNGVVNGGIALTHQGVSHIEIFNSIWRVVDDINKCKKLDIQFPSNHAKQRKIAAGFARKSAAFFELVFVGAINGTIMIWIKQPTENNKLVVRLLAISPIP